METALALAIIQAILTYGPNAVITVSKALEEGKRTPEEIKALFIGKAPEEYF
jgi:hypothetical protein